VCVCVYTLNVLKDFQDFYKINSKKSSNL